MKAILFLNTAEKLKDNTQEEDSRTSISRSYYAIIHLVKDMLKKEKIDISRRQIHNMHNIFSDCNNDRFKAIGRHISTLHQARLKSDYKLSDRVEKRHAIFHYQIACKAKKDITESFNSSDKENIIKKARELLCAGPN